jgi:hypothetical protein
MRARGASEGDRLGRQVLDRRADAVSSAGSAKGRFARHGLGGHPASTPSPTRMVYSLPIMCARLFVDQRGRQIVKLVCCDYLPLELLPQFRITSIDGWTGVA